MLMTVLALFIIFQLRHAIVIAYLHRDLCHGSVTYSPWFAQATRILQWMSSHGKFDLQYNADWAFTHKSHHKHADTMQDPYWPIMLNQSDPKSYDAEPVEKTKIDQWLEAHPWGFIMTLLWFSFFYGFLGVVFAVAIAITPRWRMIFANHAYHSWLGWRWETEKTDAARNLYYGSWFFLGEELHGNHHDYPRRANFGLAWWEFDMSYWLLKLLSLFGAVKIEKDEKITP